MDNKEHIKKIFDIIGEGNVMQGGIKVDTDTEYFYFVKGKAAKYAIGFDDIAEFNDTTVLEVFSRCIDSGMLKIPDEDFVKKKLKERGQK